MLGSNLLINLYLSSLSGCWNVPKRNYVVPWEAQTERLHVEPERQTWVLIIWLLEAAHRRVPLHISGTLTQHNSWCCNTCHMCHLMWDWMVSSVGDQCTDRKEGCFHLRLPVLLCDSVSILVLLFSLHSSRACLNLSSLTCHRFLPLKCSTMGPDLVKTCCHQHVFWWHGNVWLKRNFCILKFYHFWPF